MQSKITNPKSKIVIVGAGPAGTSLAIRLALQNFDVVLIEKEKFPRHKLCGEFISPECLPHFAELGVLNQMLSSNGESISKTIFYEPNGRNVTIASKWFSANENALGLSRSEMDLKLLERAKSLGVTVFEETQVSGLLTEHDKIIGVKTKTSEIFADLIIDATGRSRVLASKLKSRTEKIKNGNQLVGFKSHFRNVSLEKNRCEIYFFRGGYGGLNYVENEIANHCFLVQSQLVKEFNGNADAIVNEVIFKNKRAKETLENATAMFDWLAVSVSGFGVKNLNPTDNLFAVGDAGAFIDPFTGSGMLMALESAEILAKCISQNQLENYKQLHHEKFRQRLRVCSVLRRAAFVPNFAKIAISALSFSKKAQEILARSTRPKQLKQNS